MSLIHHTFYADPQVIRFISAGEVDIPQPAPDVVPIPGRPAHSPLPPDIAPPPPPEIIEPPGEPGERAPIGDPPVVTE